MALFVVLGCAVGACDTGDASATSYCDAIKAMHEAENSIAPDNLEGSHANWVAAAKDAQRYAADDLKDEWGTIVQSIEGSFTEDDATPEAVPGRQAAFDVADEDARARCGLPVLVRS